LERLFLGGAPKRLTGHTLHDGEHVLHAVREFCEQKLVVGFRKLAAADILYRHDETHGYAVAPAIFKKRSCRAS
jgi:hypothetical protein